MNYEILFVNSWIMVIRSRASDQRDLIKPVLQFDYISCYQFHDLALEIQFPIDTIMQKYELWNKNLIYTVWT